MTRTFIGHDVSARPASPTKSTLSNDTDKSQSERKSRYGRPDYTHLLYSTQRRKIDAEAAKKTAGSSAPALKLLDDFSLIVAPPGRQTLARCIADEVVWSLPHLTPFNALIRGEHIETRLKEGKSEEGLSGGLSVMIFSLSGGCIRTCSYGDGTGAIVRVWKESEGCYTRLVPLSRKESDAAATSIIDSIINVAFREAKTEVLPLTQVTRAKVAARRRKHTKAASAPAPPQAAAASSSAVTGGLDGELWRQLEVACAMAVRNHDDGDDDVSRARRLAGALRAGVEVKPNSTSTTPESDVGSSSSGGLNESFEVVCLEGGAAGAMEVSVESMEKEQRYLADQMAKMAAAPQPNKRPGSLGKSTSLRDSTPSNYATTLGILKSTSTSAIGQAWGAPDSDDFVLDSPVFSMGVPAAQTKDDTEATTTPHVNAMQTSDSSDEPDLEAVPESGFVPESRRVPSSRSSGRGSPVDTKDDTDVTMRRSSSMSIRRDSVVDVVQPQHSAKQSSHKNIFKATKSTIKKPLTKLFKSR